MLSDEFDGYHPRCVYPADCASMYDGYILQRYFLVIMLELNNLELIIYGKKESSYSYMVVQLYA